MKKENTNVQEDKAGKLSWKVTGSLLGVMNNRPTYERSRRFSGLVYYCEPILKRLTKINFQH